MERRWLFTLLILCGYLLVSCSLLTNVSEDAIATAIAETAIVEEIQAYYKTRTAEAQATNTPEPTTTDPPVPSATPLPSLTPTPEPPAGMAYVPDFVGMPYEEASEILNEMGWNEWYYIAIINKEVDDWTVVDQEPEPGTLIDLGDDRVKLIVAVSKFTPTPTPTPPPRYP